MFPLVIGVGVALAVAAGTRKYMKSKKNPDGSPRTPADDFPTILDSETDK